ncbi:MAG: hypothetical protein L7F77_01430 [Candidatus Magnetominusculus sp. LBB02]|nr:hypothetical protein [Candidatus Magnetominusculus sp. LBB02]
MTKHEFKVVVRLLSAEKEAFLPTVVTLNKWTDREKLVEFPQFPQYLFGRIRASSKDKLFVLQTMGVIRFSGVNKGSGYGYETVPDQQTSNLKIISESKAIVNPIPFMIEGH